MPKYMTILLELSDDPAACAHAAQALTIGANINGGKIVATRLENLADERRARRWAAWAGLLFVACSTGALMLATTSKYVALALWMAPPILVGVLYWMDGRRTRLVPGNARVTRQAA
jgi:hypothetical protein